MRISNAFAAVVLATTGFVYGKFLDDNRRSYGTAPIPVGCINADPRIGFLPCNDIREPNCFLPLTSSYTGTDHNNNRRMLDARGGLAAKVKAFSMEARFDIAGWMVTNRFRLSHISGAYNDKASLVTAPARFSAQSGGPSRHLSYATGQLSMQTYADLESLGNVTNDLRAARVWEVGEGKFATTASGYNSRQDIGMFWNFTSILQDLAGGGRNLPVNITTVTGIPVTDAATLEAFRTGEEISQHEVGASAQRDSTSREIVTGTSVVTASDATTEGQRDCITVTDIAIIEGEEARAEKRMCRAPGSARYLIVF